MAEFDAFRDTRTPQTLNPCFSCGRKFNPETLEKHEKICSSQKQRKVFDSRKQRLQGTEIPTAVKKPDPPPSKGRDKGNWKAKHENLIATLRAARGQGLVAPALVDPGYVECQYCNRNFNEYAAERHIPFCKEQQARLRKNPPDAAKDKLNKRTKYKPPLPGAKKGSSSSLASDSSSAKQKTPARGMQNSSSAGIQKRSPAASPGMRRRIQSDQSDQIDSRALRRQASASPPPQKPNSLGVTRKLDTNYSYNQRTPQGPPRVSSGSSSDSDAHRSGSGHKRQDPTWFKDLMNTENNSILKERDFQVNSKGRYNSRSRENSAHDALDFDEKPIKPRRRSQIETDDFSDHKPATVGVVRPSSRQTSDKEERTPSGRRKLANFCHECGTKYPVANAKFCCECGLKRMHIEL